MSWIGRILIWIVGLAALAGLAVFVFFKVRSLVLIWWQEWSAITHYRLREAVQSTRQYIIDGWEDLNRRREWQYIAGLSDEVFADLVKRHRDAAARQNKLADILMHEGRRRGGKRLAFLTERAKARRADATARLTEAKRLERLRAEIKASHSNGGSKGGPGNSDKGTREPPKRPRNQREQILGLIDKLGSNIDLLAEAALAEFNDMGSALLWENLVPDDLPRLVKSRLVKILRQMSRTSSLGEARNARAQAEYILKTHNLSWAHMRDGQDRKAA